MRRVRLTPLLPVLVATLVALGLVGPLFASAAEASQESLAIQSVDTSKYPRITMNVLLPPEMLAGGAPRTSDFAVRENDAVIEKVSVRTLEASRRDPVYAVLAIDTSGSMEGQALEDAKRAALEFVRAMADEDRIALITFGESVVQASGFTSDRPALETVIGGLQAGGETALYDAIATASGMFGDLKDAERAIVLLSDGGDTVSTTSIDQAAAAISASKAPVHAVALQTDEYNPSALDSLARSSGGRLVPVGESEQFVATFAGIAKQLSSPYEVTFTSAQPPTKDVLVELTVTSRDLRATASSVVPNPRTAATSDAPAAAPSLPSLLWVAVIALLAFVAVAALAGGALSALQPRSQALKQLSAYDQTTVPTADGGAAGYGEDSFKDRLMGAADSLTTKSGFASAVSLELERAGLPLRATEYMTIHAVAVLVAGLLVQLLSRNLLLTTCAVLLFALGPIVLLRYLVQKRLNTFQEQLPDVLNLLASSLRAGWGLLQAVGIVVSEMAPPAGPEFGRVVTEARLGIPVEQALAKMAARLDSQDFQWAVTAIAIQREVGGNLAEVLDIVAGTVRERGTLRRQVSSLTAEGRLSAIILVALPFVEAGLLLVVNPRYITTLLTSTLGVITAMGALLLIVVGAIWLKNIVSIEV